MENLERQTLRLMAYRTIVALTFFLSALGIQAAVGGGGSLKPFYYFIACVMGVNLLHLIVYALFHEFRKTPTFLYLQLGSDSLSITFLSFLTGGFSSIFVFLYHVLILVAGYLLKRRGAFTIATLNSIVFGLLCVGLFYGWLRPELLVPTIADRPSPQDTLYALMANYLGFFLVAGLVSVMSGRIESTRETLGLVQKDLSSLRHLNDQIVSSMSSGLVTTGVDGIVTFANDAALNLLGESYTSGWNLLAKLRSLAQEGPGMDLDTRSRGEFIFELPGERQIDVLLTPLMEGGKQLGQLALLLDQTEMAGLKRQLAVKESMAATGEMAANIAHEIRNPLGSISGSAQMLRKSVPEGSSEKALLTIIQNESARLSDILDNFIRFSNPPPLKLERVNLKELAEEVLSLFHNDPSCGQQIKIERNMHTGISPIQADPDRFRQALWNLLLNARKAQGDTGWIRVGLSASEGRVILEVEDGGIGMQPQSISGYLQPFRKGFAKGAGLGLSVVYRIMEQHGGRMEIRSAPGKGTTVRLIFPATRSEASPASGFAEQAGMRKV